MLKKLHIALFYISLALLLSACGGGGGGNTAPAPTKAILTLNIKTTPTTLLGELEVDVKLPEGVTPSKITEFEPQVADLVDPTNSVTMISTSATNSASTNYPIPSFKPSTNILKLVIINFAGGQADGNYAKIDCRIAPGTVLSSSSFPSSLTTVISAADKDFNPIPATDVQISIDPLLQ